MELHLIFAFTIVIVIVIAALGIARNAIAYVGAAVILLCAILLLFFLYGGKLG